MYYTQALLISALLQQHYPTFQSHRQLPYINHPQILLLPEIPDFLTEMPDYLLVVHFEMPQPVHDNVFLLKL